MSNNSDMIKMLRLVEGQQFAGLPEQRPGDQVRGTERAKKNGRQHPFHNRLVGEEISLEDKLAKKYQDMKDLHGKDKDVAEEGSENKYSNLSNRGVNRGINRAGDDFNRMLDLDQAESPHYKTQHQQDTKQRLKTEPMAGPKGVLPEGSQRVDSLVTDALRVMKGAEVSDAVSALKTVLGDREYNDRPGFYKFYIKQMLDMYGQQGVAEAGMPSSVVKSKQRYAAMSDKEFHAAHKNKSAEELQAMAWRHGYGKGSNHYVDKHKKGSTVTEGQEEIEYTCSGCSGSGEGPHEGTTCRTCHGSGVEMGYADEPEHEHDEEELDEGWKDKLAAAALAGTMALGAAGAHARVVPGQDDPGINRLTGKPIATQVAPSDAKPELKAPTGYSKEYLQSVVDGTHPRPMVSVEKAQQLLGQMNEESDYGSNESPMERPMLHRIMMRHMDLIEKYGIDRVLAAVRDVADSMNIGPDDEIGTSDVSAAMNNVMNELKSQTLDEYGSLPGTSAEPVAGTTAPSSGSSTPSSTPASDEPAGGGSPNNTTLSSPGAAGAVSAGGSAPTTPSTSAGGSSTAKPAASTAPQPNVPDVPITPDEKAALDRIRANAGLKTQFDNLLKQVQPKVQ